MKTWFPLLAVGCFWIPQSEHEARLVAGSNPDSAVDGSDGGNDGGDGDGETGGDGTDSGCPERSWYPDTDGDGHGAPDEPVRACEAPVGYLADATDCDDADSEVFPANGLGDCTDCEAAGVLHVPSDYTFITDAIAAASDGDIICVAPGAYGQTIDFDGKNITLYGEGGPEETVLHGGGEAPIVRFDSGESDEAILNGFSVGNAAGVDDGGGIFINGSFPTLVRLEVTDNDSVNRGGGVFIDGGGPRLERVALLRNQAMAGGGLAIVAGSVEMHRVRVEQNHTAQDLGMGLLIHDSAATLSNVVVLDNTTSSSTATFGGGAAHVFDSTFAANNLIVAGHGPMSTGGGLWFQRCGEVVITNATFAFNTAEVGGAVVFEDCSGEATLSNVAVVGNAATEGGAAVEVEGSSTLAITYSDFYDNPDGDVGGADFVIGTDGNLAVDPLFLAADPDDDPSSWDFNLQSGSPLIDAGDPDLLDVDGSRSDIGATGGPEAHW